MKFDLELDIRDVRRPRAVNGKASLARSAFLAAARAFAELEARKAGMTDLRGGKKTVRSEAP